jgi:hypothetical protein
MHRLGVLRVSLVLLAFGFSATAASAGSPTSFQLPAVQVPSPGCESFPSGCHVQAGPVTTSFGTFTINETGDVTRQDLVFGPPLDKDCFAVSGTTMLDFGSGDTLALRSSASDTLCLTQNVDSNGVPSPQAGPWPLVVTLSVDGAASTGIYAGASGRGSLEGSWIVNPNDPNNPFPKCVDDTGQPVAFCGFSGETLVFTLNTVSIPDLQTVGGGGGCTVNCGGGGPGATPELDSIFLFGSALFSLGGYAVLRRRASRRRA